MKTVQVEVSLELAQRLQEHADNLAQIIEWGLCVAEAREKQAVFPVIDTNLPERSAILEALRSTGLMINLDTDLAARYQGNIGRPRRTPVYVQGTPLSKIIVAERGPEWPEDS